MSDRQTTNHVMMVEPVGFYANPQTMDSNVFQHESGGENQNIAQQAREESLGLRRALLEHGVQVMSVMGQNDCPDDLFCNNWVSTHDGGHMVLYPVLAENRRKERAPDTVNKLTRLYPNRWDFTAPEQDNLALESTGSFALDRVNKVAYAALSERTDRDLAEEWCRRMGYRLVDFISEDRDGKPIYHTNVMMFVGTSAAGICLESIRNETTRRNVLAQLEQTHDVVDLGLDQIYHFCGNMLELKSEEGKKLLTMSESAMQALTRPQKEKLLQHVDELVAVPISTIEKYGGGSVRCMLLELF